MNSKYFEINTNGNNIRCKLYYDNINDIKNIVVFGHGFGGHKDNGAAQKFAEHMIKKNKNCALVTFNWPCHGDDVRKKLNLQTCQDYLNEVTEYLERDAICLVMPQVLGDICSCNLWQGIRTHL